MYFELPGLLVRAERIAVHSTIFIPCRSTWSFIGRLSSYVSVGWRRVLDHGRSAQVLASAAGQACFDGSGLLPGCHHWCLLYGRSEAGKVKNIFVGQIQQFFNCGMWQELKCTMFLAGSWLTMTIHTLPTWSRLFTRKNSQSTSPRTWSTSCTSM